MKFLFQKKFLFLSLISLLFLWGAFFALVDLEPDIGPDFFFAKESKIFQKNEKIRKKFPFNGNQVLLGLPHKDVLSEKYLARVKRISEKLQEFKEVKRVVSITHGPSDPEDALTNPLWKRIVTAGRKDVTFISVYLGTKNHGKIITVMEDIIRAYGKVGIPIKIAGIPYFVEQMKRNLKSDMSRFLLASILLCSLTLFVIHRSFLLTLFSIVSSLSAAALSILILHFMGQGIGILTANLMVIAYVLTQSHVIFYSSNYKELKDSEKAFNKTLPASFWSMTTTLLGFVGLMFVEAKPLVELGIGGVVASLCAFFMCYLLIPSLISFYKPKEGKSVVAFKNRRRNILGPGLMSFFIFGALTVGPLGLTKIDTDPSLLKYFKQDGEIFKQISFLNDRGGSNILRIVLKRKDGQNFDNDKSYNELWKLQESLKKHPQVGSVVSLPVMMKESDQHWLGQFLSWDWTVDLLTSEAMDKVGQGFVSEDRKETAFVLKMVEAREGKVDRLKVVNEIKDIVKKGPFSWISPAGNYYLQGELAKSVKESLVKGVSGLILIFFFVLLWVSRSIIVATAVSFFLGLLVILIFGTMGISNIPMDLISSPAISIALGIAIDSLIHLIRTVRESKGGVENIQSWKKGVSNQGEAIITSGVTITVGFSVFLLSTFPPSQRFGGLIIAGTLLALPITLVIIPEIFKFFSKRRVLS